MTGESASDLASRQNLVLCKVDNCSIEAATDNWVTIIDYHIIASEKVRGIMKVGGVVAPEQHHQYANHGRLAFIQHCHRQIISAQGRGTFKKEMT